MILFSGISGHESGEKRKAARGMLEKLKINKTVKYSSNH